MSIVGKFLFSSGKLYVSVLQHLLPWKWNICRCRHSFI